MSHFPDTPSDKRIKECIKEEKNFSVIAGAGSGKTTSLIKALDFVRITKGDILRKNGQRVVCITYTNRAVDVILKRLNSDELFLVSTIHSFLWSEINPFKDDIKSAMKDFLLPKRIEKTESKAQGGSKVALAARERFEELQKSLDNIDSVTQFKYDDSSSRNYDTGQLDHDDIIDLSGYMIKEILVLRKILGQKYPFIFIDEAQDTFEVIVEALNKITDNEGLPIVGYFGDPMQQIYDDGVGDFNQDNNLEKIPKEENYRCPSEVIKLLNSFRKDIKQKQAGQKKQKGSVKIILVKAEEPKEKRNTYTPEQLEKAFKQFDRALDKLGWKDDNEVKRLFLSRQMIANRLGFPELNKLFRGKYSSENSKNRYDSGEHYLLKPFLKTLVPIIMYDKLKDYKEVFQILKSTSPLLHPKKVSSKKTIREVRQKVTQSMEGLTKAWKDKTLKEIIELSKKFKLIEIPEKLSEELKRPERKEEYKEEEHGKDKGDWLADRFFKMKTSELKSYIDFINDKTPFSTQHGVKGEEYDKVLVFYDDKEANWNKFSFAKLLTPQSVGKESTEKQKKRSTKLAYVSFSRSKKDLAIILFTPKVEIARQELINQGYFSEDQIENLDE